MTSGAKRHEKRVDERLEQARGIADRLRESITLPQLEAMTHSSDTVTRLAGALLLQDEAERGGTIRPIMETARRLICDGACRWQAFNAIANGIPAEPELVWQIIAEFGSSKDSDMRAGVATVLLEHLLESHFDEYFSLVRDRALGDPAFLETLSLCWFPEDDEAARRIRNLLRTARRGRRSG